MAAHQAGVVGDVEFRVVLESELYGREYFSYDTLQDTLEAVTRLTAAASHDGIEPNR